MKKRIMSFLEGVFLIGFFVGILILDSFLQAGAIIIILSLVSLLIMFREDWERLDDEEY